VSLANKFIGNNGCQLKDIGRSGPGSNGFVRTDFERCSKLVSFIAYDGGHDAVPLGVENFLAPDTIW
jgi:hypothetical protein